MGVWWAPKGVTILAGLNAAIALLVLVYAASRSRYILAAMDWPYLGLIAFEALIMIAAIGAFRGSRGALICSFVAFGIHALAGIAAVFFAFGFKFTKLM